MPSPGREAYRAIYLASPLKFCTTLHAFTRVLPRFHIDPWQKDPQAAEKHKWHGSQARKRGRWFYRYGPLSGVRIEGWPDPGLLGSGELVQVASRAQAEGLQDTTFWLQVAERAIKLRDIMRVGDLAVVLDTLVSANYRHTQLMKTLTREFIDDVEKMTLVELAVVAHAYAHFNCVSEPLLKAFAQHTARLLSGGDCGPFVRPGGDVDSNPQSLAVLSKACATLQRSDAAMFRAINGAVLEHAAGLSFDSLAELWVAFAKLEQPFQADESFWSGAVGKVVGSRMASLCPALRASAMLQFRQPALREALAAEIVKGLGEAPTGAPPAPFGTALGLWEGGGETSSSRPALPAFATEKLSRSVLAALVPEASAASEGGEAAADAPPPFPAGPALAEETESVVVEWANDALVAESGPESVEVPASAAGGKRFYNAVSRRLSRAARPSYLQFDASDHFARNRRGALVAEAVEGLNILWRDGPQVPVPAPSPTPAAAKGAAPEAAARGQALKPLAVPPGEAALLEAAGPVLRGALQGLAAPQLASCAEAIAFYAANADAAAPPPNRALLRDLVQEAVRKLSNFSAGDLRRLHEACQQMGLRDPYLERARQRRFPKALQLELAAAEAAASAEAS